MDDNLTRQPLYQQVADRLRADITAGHYNAEGGRLPSESELMSKYDVVRDTCAAPTLCSPTGSASIAALGGQ